MNVLHYSVVGNVLLIEIYINDLTCTFKKLVN